MSEEERERERERVRDAVLEQKKMERITDEKREERN